MPTPSQQAANICQLCYSQGHYDYQCQFAGDFMACTQKAFNQGRSYCHQDPNNGEWSQGDGDNCRGITRIHRLPSRPSHPYG